MSELSDAEIRAAARFVEPREAAHDAVQATGFKLMRDMAEISGLYLHIVKWPNGVVVICDSDSKHTPNWDAIIAAYRRAEAGERGFADRGDQLP
jgi:hypothetical protein